ncbi:MAG: NUDIX domain-containing protein [Dysgonamonadaceae bacterium]|jgi:isopentenyl-diphosphate delta-isomerase|nr:NUDIX domain-containing protein [Dysgonamonadaceae bacterium]
MTVQTKTNKILLLGGPPHDTYDAHKLGLPHYAFSVFIFNSNGELLMQKRAGCKYHSGGLWSNTCCSHPLSDDILQIRKYAEERLLFEMGISSPLEYVFDFNYKAQCGDLIENEHDYVFIGYSNAEPQVNPIEVEDYKWIDMESIEKDRIENPQKYTVWFNFIMNRYYFKIKTFLRKRNSEKSMKMAIKNKLLYIKSIFTPVLSVYDFSDDFVDKIIVSKELSNNSLFKKITKKRKLNIDSHNLL